MRYKDTSRMLKRGKLFLNCSNRCSELQKLFLNRSKQPIDLVISKLFKRWQRKAISKQVCAVVMEVPKLYTFRHSSPKSAQISSSASSSCILLHSNCFVQRGSHLSRCGLVPFHPDLDERFLLHKKMFCTLQLKILINSVKFA